MAYVVYNVETTKLLAGRRAHRTERAAKMALTRAVNAGMAEREDFAIAEHNKFYSEIEKTRTVRSVMTGEMVEEPVNTPYHLSVGSESYWSA